MLQIAAAGSSRTRSCSMPSPTSSACSLDVAALQAKRDRLVTALRGMGYEVASPEGTFYLWPRSPVPDDEAFVASLERRGVLVMPGALFETPGWFRICLTATAESIEAALPHFRAAIEATRQLADGRPPPGGLGPDTRPELRRRRRATPPTSAPRCARSATRRAPRPR